MPIAVAVALLVAQAASRPALAPPPAAPAAKGARAAEGAPRTVLVVPFALKGEAPEWAGFAISEVITDAVAQHNRDNFITFKQLDAVLRRRDVHLADAAVPEAAAELARALGATDVIVGEATKADYQYTITARHLRAATGAELKAAHVDGPFTMLPRLAQLLAQQLLDVPKEQEPLTGDAAALEQVTRCQLALARQSLGPRARPALPEERLKAADQLCAAALEADPQLSLAHAGLAVALAARGNFPGAKEEVRLAQAGRFAPLSPLTESWIARRSGDGPAATAALENAVGRHPGFLHALGYLGEERMEAGDEPGALKIFERYLARAPEHPWAMAKKARELSRLGKKEEAIALTLAALKIDPGDPELVVELASRYIDNGRDDLAEEQLKLAMNATPPRPLASLRLGYLYLRGKKLKESRVTLKRCLREATREDEGRTRGTAHADLARVAGLTGNYVDALAELRLARAEGLRRLPCAEPEIAQWKAKAELAELCEDGGVDSPLAEGEDIVAVDLQ